MAKAARILEDLSKTDTNTNTSTPNETPAPTQTKDEKGRLTTCAVTDEEMEKAGATDTSKRIRYLIGQGYSPSAVAKRLNKRYQHVRNVMLQPLKRQG